MRGVPGVHSSGEGPSASLDTFFRLFDSSGQTWPVQWVEPNYSPECRWFAVHDEANGVTP